MTRAQRTRDRDYAQLELRRMAAALAVAFGLSPWRRPLGGWRS